MSEAPTPAAPAGDTPPQSRLAAARLRLRDPEVTRALASMLDDACGTMESIGVDLADAEPSVSIGFTKADGSGFRVTLGITWTAAAATTDEDDDER